VRVHLRHVDNQEKLASRSLGGRRISVQTAEKSVSFVDTSSANSYGYWLVSITKRYSIFDGLPSKPSAAQTPSRRITCAIRY
jgi:hypothetical protein